VESDVLGVTYQRRLIALDPDDEGEVVATLVSRRAAAPSGRAVLYLHGFVDYFFQTHLADYFAERGWDFYALDLRKYGRSLLPHQTANFARSMDEYFPEIDEAIRIIREDDGHDTVLLNGHSTGGLIAALWAHRVRGRGLVQGLFLNSPFLEFNEPWIVRRGVTPVVKLVGAVRPYATLPQQLGTTYGLSLHRDHHGEWEYNLEWKPLAGYPIRAGWVRAIRQGHRRAQAGLSIDAPVLVACSATSYRGPYADAAHHADAVLDVEHIARYGPRLGTAVTVLRVEGGKHDLTLSAAPVRERLFTDLGDWLETHFPGSKPVVAVASETDPEEQPAPSA
jgi:alpha-beta hydrolase superfamily lysophospholipase